MSNKKDDIEAIYKLLEKYQRKVEECHRLREKIKEYERNMCKCKRGE